MAGLRNEATLSLSITVNKGAGIESIRKDLEALANVIKAKKFAEGMEGFNTALKNAQASTAKLTAENQKLKTQLAAQQAENKKLVAAEKARMAAMKEALAAEKARGAAAKSGLQDILGAGAKRKNQLNEEIERTRALDASNKQNADRHVQSYRVIEDAAKRKAATEKKAASEAAQANAKALTAEKQMIAERKAGLQAAIAAATREHALATARKMAAAMAKQGMDNSAKHRNLFIQLSNATNQNTQTILRNVAAAKQMFRNWGAAQAQARKTTSFISQFSKALSEAEKKMDALFRASFRLSIVGHTLRRFSDTIVRFGMGILTVYEDFEYMMLRAAGALEIWMDATWDGVKAFDVLRDRLLEVAEGMKLFKAEDVAQALYFWGSATGQVVEDVDSLNVSLTGLDKIMKAAAMTNTGYEQTIKGVYSILTQYYHGSLDKAVEVTEKLFLSTQKTAAEWMDLVQSFKMVGPVAAQVGADFDQVNEALGLLSDLGLRGSMAGRGLRQLFIQIARPSGPAQAKWRELFEQNPVGTFEGQSFRDVVFPEGKFIGITNLMTELAKATQHLNEADRLQAISRVTTANSLPLVTALIARQRNELLGLVEAENKFVDATGKAISATDYFNKNWMALEASWRGTRESLLRMVESIKIHLGAKMAEALTPLVERFNKFLAVIRDFVKLNPDLVKVVTNFGAIAAVGSLFAGTLFIIGGALVGLFAAVNLVWDATEKWRVGIGRLISLLGFLLMAVVDNFDYLKNAATKIIDNLNKAFKDITVSGDDFLSVINDITMPAREILGFFVRWAADIAVLASQLLAGASQLQHFGDAVSIVIKVLSALISAKIIVGIWNIVKALIGLQTVTLRGAITSSIESITKALNLLTKAGMLAALEKLIAKLRVLMASMGPAGWAALAVSLGITFGLMKDLGNVVKDVTAEWRHLNAELDESASHFGSGADAIKLLAESYAPSVKKVEQVTLQLTESGKELSEYFKNEAGEYLPWFTDEKGSPKLIDPSMGREAIDLLLLEMATYAQSEFSFDDWLAVDDLVRAARDDHGALVQVHRDIVTEKIDFTDEWVASNEALNKQIILSGREVTMSGAEYQRALNSISTIVGPITGDLGKDIALGLPEGHQGHFIDDIVNFFMGSIGDKTSIAEIESAVQSVNKIFGNVLAEEFTFARAFSLVGAGRIAKMTSANEQAIMDLLQEQMSNIDYESLRKFLTTPHELFGGIAPMSAFGMRDFAFAEQMLELLQNHYAEIADSMILEGASRLEPTAAVLKNALEMMATEFFLQAFPQAEEVAGIMQDLVVSNTKQDYEALAEMFMTEMVGPEKLIEALKSGTLKGSTAAAFIALAQEVVAQGIGSPAFQEAVASLSETAGEETGETLARNWNEAFLSGLESLGNISFDEFKEAAGLGSVKRQIASATKKLNRMINYGRTHAVSPQGRAIMRGTRKEITDTTIAAASARRERGNAEGANRVTTRGVKAITSGYADETKGGKKAIIKQASRLADEAPNTVQTALLNSDAPPKVIEALIEGIFGKPGTGPAAPSIETAVQSLLPADTISTAATEVVTDALSSMLAIPDPVPLVTPEILSSMLAIPQPMIAEALNPASAAIVDELAVGVEAGMVTRSPAMASSVLGTVASSITTAESSSKAMYQSGKDRAGDWRNGWVYQFGIMGPASIQGAIGSALGAATAGILPQAWGWGSSVGMEFASGVETGIASYQINLVGKFDVIESNSPPKKGPLKNIGKWGESIGALWSQGLSKGIRQDDAFRSLSADMRQFTGKDISMSQKREVKVKLEVTSPDGSVNRQKQGEMRRGALEALTVAGLEHYVTVG